MQIYRGKVQKAIKVVVYGTEGIGKSTFASAFPNPVFIDTEGSTAHMDVARTEQPKTFAELLEQIRYLAKRPDEVGTVVIDTADWAEKLAVKSLCEAKHIQGVEDLGYGKGYVFAYEDMGRMLNALNECIDHGINVVVTAHAAIRKFEQPDELGSYDRWELKCINAPKANVCAMLKEWADMVLFVNYKTITVKNADSKKVKATGGVERVMYTSHRATFDAKNRFRLPDEMPFSFDGIAHLFNASNNAPESDSKAFERETDNVSSEMREAAEPIATAAFSAQNGAYEDEVNVPEELRRLMETSGVHAHELRLVVSQRGYFPNDMPISDYPREFVNEWCIPCWPQITKAVEENRTELPFN